MKFKILARHEWVAGAKITESGWRDGTLSGPLIHRFTATIRGYQNWKIYQGIPTPDAVDFVIDRVKNVRDRIDAGDESVFDEPNEFEITKNVVHEDDLCQCDKLKPDWRSHCDNCNALGDLDALADGLP